MRRNHKVELCCSYGLWPGSPRGNSKGKRSGRYARRLSLIRSNSPPCWSKVLSLSAAVVRQVKWWLPRNTLGDYVLQIDSRGSVNRQEDVRTS